MRKTLRILLLAPLVFLLLFEEWGWDPLARGFAALARHRVWAATEQKIRQLPPWAAVLVFVVPVLALIPVKLLALYLFGRGHAMLGLSLIVVAKLAGTAVAARLFQLTEPALMRNRWFARIYFPWKNWKDSTLAQWRASRIWLLVRKTSLRAKTKSAQLWAAIKTWSEG